MNHLKNILCITSVLLLFSCNKGNSGNGNFSIFDGEKITTVVYDHKGTDLDSISAYLLAEDIERVTGVKPEVKKYPGFLEKPSILVGSLHSDFIKTYMGAKLPEGFAKQTSEGKHYIIAGTYARGTAFGVFSISEKIGVSPWYWWADVPVKKPGFMPQCLYDRRRG